ncbi:ATP-binding protein [Thermanaeromonas sp. C210]|uniref:ATP-binding protein n=1 Tax=Thermanaeromonas sp. C210 TaxID=2731925 RepID=UPI00155D1423|nr:ATP-binding protein [Thermanaeromonas sp. C210]GFN22846.1 histidine kinase [Thermanaeromonas sp. C210]
MGLKGLSGEQLATLIKINNITGYLPLDLPQVLGVIGKELEKLFPPYRCFFLLLNFQYLGIKDIDGETFHGPCGRTIRDCKVVKEQLPVVVDEVKAQHRCCRYPCGRQCLARICVPLVAGTEVLGALSLKSTQPVAFSRAQLDVLLAIANQTAATIQRARLFNRLAWEKERLAQANRDIAALNRALEETIRELQTAQRQLILSERLAAAGRLAANLTHEINNPLGIILTRLELLELEAEKLSLPEAVLKDLAVIKKHVSRIARIARGLLAFSRQTLQGVELVSLNKLIQETVDWLEEQFARQGISFSLQLVDLPLIKGSREQLQQVLVNLLTNARDALPAGGEIKITTALHGDKKEIQVDISDNGVGIPPSNLDKIFEPFFTTKTAGQGTGLGLSISYAIVKKHGGKMEVSSTEGKGTTVSIKLPIPDEGDAGDR